MKTFNFAVLSLSAFSSLFAFSATLPDGVDTKDEVQVERKADDSGKMVTTRKYKKQQLVKDRNGKDVIRETQTETKTVSPAPPSGDLNSR